MAELIMKTNIFDIDFEKGTFKPRETVELVQYDNKTNLFVFYIKNEMAVGNSLMLKIKHYEGNEFEYPLAIKDNKAQVLITNNVTYIPGEIKMSVSLIGTDNRILTAVEMLENIPIIEAIQDEMPPEEEVNAFIQLISENNELKKEMQELIEDHIRRLDAGEYDGAEVELQRVDEYIQWKYTDETEWKKLASMEELIGPKGDKGAAAFYVSDVEPEDPEVMVWIDTSEDSVAIQVAQFITEVNEILNYVNGMIDYVCRLILVTTEDTLLDKLTNETGSVMVADSDGSYVLEQGKYILYLLTGQSCEIEITRDDVNKGYKVINVPQIMEV